MRATAPAGPYSSIATPVTVASQPNGYLDTPATNGTTYYYYLVSYAAGSPSANSVTVSATAALAPTTPTGLTAVDGSGSVTLNWIVPATVNNVPVTQYIITSTPGSPVTVNSAAAPGAGATATLTSLTNGTSYGFQIQAMNENGTVSPLSSTVNGYPFTPFPATGTGFGGTDSSTAVTLAWTAPGGLDWPPATSYSIIRVPLAGGTPATFSTASTSYTDAAVTLGQAYLYTLTATDNHGNSSLVSGPVTDGPSNPPNAPTTLVADVGSGEVILDWPSSAPPAAGSGSLPVSYYLLTINGGAPVSLPSTQTWFLDSGLVDPAGVTATIQAVDLTENPSGNHISVVVAAPTVTTSGSDLNPPTGLAVTALSPTNNLITWTVPNDLGNVILSYNIYRSGSFISTLGSPMTVITNPAAGVTLFNDTNVSPNSTYYYVVTATYQQLVGTAPSPPSNNATDTTPAPAAGIPSEKVGQMAFDANLLKPLTGQTLNIFFIAPASGPVEIDVYNVSGNPIRALYATAIADTQVSTPWDGKDRNGRYVASGIYLVEIKAPGLHQVKKVLVVK
jgi:titin